MLLCRQAFEVGKPIVTGVSINVMDVTAARYLPESAAPNVPVKLVTAPRKIRFIGPKTVEAAIEILRERIKDDWIDVFGRRHSADFQPLSVKNK
ncbi:MAG: hypothetical protein ACLPJW_12675 [Rhodomicrobium sp.]